jgi:hypothetical protein
MRKVGGKSGRRLDVWEKRSFRAKVLAAMGGVDMRKAFLLPVTKWMGLLAAGALFVDRAALSLMSLFPWTAKWPVEFERWSRQEYPDACLSWSEAFHLWCWVQHGSASYCL